MCVFFLCVFACVYNVLVSCQSFNAVNFANLFARKRQVNHRWDCANFNIFKKLPKIFDFTLRDRLRGIAKMTIFNFPFLLPSSPESEK